MSFADKTLQCSDCNTSFTFTAGEQESFARRGYTNATLFVWNVAFFG